MAINHDTLDESVYIQSDIVERAKSPVYAAASDLIQRFSSTRQILDLGCSDGVATFNLSPEYTVFGVDLSHSALIANSRQPGVRADIRNLPIREGSEIDTVLLLDVLEHEKWQDSINVLESIREIASDDHSVVVSMPIISGLSVETWHGLIQIARDGKRPDMGLFDRTHQILRGVRGHLKLFAEAGYTPVEIHSTNRIEGITGVWSFKPPATPQDRPELQGTHGLGRLARVAQLSLRPLEGSRRNMLYHESQRANYPRLSKLGRALAAFQGVYLLKPDKAK